MAITHAKLASKLGFTDGELQKKVHEVGFDVEDEYDDETAGLLLSELLGKTDKNVEDIYEELSEVAKEKEIVKSQRKQKAGKISKGPKKIVRESVGPKATQTEIPDHISVKELAEKTGIGAASLIGALMKNGILANINQIIDFDTAQIITDGSGVKLIRKRSEEVATDLFLGNLEKLLAEDDKSVLTQRPPVVSVMGHVDHGKTSLLDAIRDTNVVATESGGITQHIGAYQVVKNGRAITFLDTPGHEAFTAMRARGAKATDIAILVVAADDGVKPQTEEAINHAKEAGIPIIVAINKMDKPGANPDRVKAELAERGLQPEEWGGDTMMVPISALKRQGIDKVLECVLLVADILELKANTNRPGVATVIESHLDASFGPVATILINTGTLKVGDNVIVGKAMGKIKMMRDHTGKKLKILNPSDTAQIAGLSDTVQSGQILQVVKDEKTARQQIGQIREMYKDEAILRSGMGMQEILNRIKEGSLKLLKIIVKTDTIGSLEAIKQSLAKIKTEDIAIKIIHSGVGSITESDVMMAAASPGTLIVGFHTKASAHVLSLAERASIEVVVYSVIYELIEDLTKILSGMLKPESILVELGKFKVMKVFFTGKGEMVVGGKITEGIIQSSSKCRVWRETQQVGDGDITGLKLVNEDAKELSKGDECGVRYKGKIKLMEGDILEAWKIEKKMKTL